MKRLVPDGLGPLLRELPSLPTRRAILLGWAAPAPILVEIQDLPKTSQPESPDPAFWDVWTGKSARRIDWATIAASSQREGMNRRLPVRLLPVRRCPVRLVRHERREQALQMQALTGSTVPLSTDLRVPLVQAMNPILGSEPMAVKDITTRGAEAPLDEFRRIGLYAMLERYGGRPSTRWLVEVDGRRFDQKVLLRAAHVCKGFGTMPPRGPGWFNAGHARRHLEGRLGYRVVASVASSDR